MNIFREEPRSKRKKLVVRDETHRNVFTKRGNLPNGSDRAK